MIDNNAQSWLKTFLVLSAVFTIVSSTCEDNNQLSATRNTWHQTVYGFPLCSSCDIMEVEKQQALTASQSLKEFGYVFDDSGVMCHVKTGEQYIFKHTDNDEENQKRYEALGKLITEYVYELMEDEYHLQRHHVPVSAGDNEPRSFFFATKDALTNKERLLILIHGSGVVRAGQWARRLIINENIDSGSQLPFIGKAVDEGYAVVVLNTNLNSALQGDKETSIAGNSTPESHAVYVWKHFISGAKAKNIAIIAHSYGGIVTTHMVKTLKEDLTKRVFAIAFTDSVHSIQMQDAGKIVAEFYKKHAKNWVSSEKDLDTPIESMVKDAPMVSAGHSVHEWTSSTSFASIFKFLDEKYRDRIKS